MGLRGLRGLRRGPGPACVILAAGLGTRMKSPRPKVLHPLLGKPMLGYAIEAAARLRSSKTVLVVSPDHDAIKNALPSDVSVTLAVQKGQKGTAHAMLAALPSLEGNTATVLVMNGDTPLVDPKTLGRFLGLHRRAKNAVSVLSFRAEDPAAYGRIVRNAQGDPVAIVEQRDASREQLAIDEVNSGIYAIEPSALPLLSSIPVNKKKKEYYLTDLLALSVSLGRRAGVFSIGREEDFLGINTQEELAVATAVLKWRVNEEHMKRGVSLIDPETVYISPDARIGTGTLIYPNVIIEGQAAVGKGCTIYSNVRIVNSTIKDRALVRDSSLIEESVVGPDASVGPFAHLRPESRIGPGARIGNFVEVKKSEVGRGTKALHLSYIGDTTLGRNVNIGAGTITCNYDGERKHRTVIGDGVFIGSDTQLVAPVSIGKGAYVGAGSTITKDVPADSLAITRTAQKTIKGWPSQKKKRRAGS